MATTAKPTPSWRDVLKIHPAAELFPLMPPDELKALGEDIKKNGLTSSIATTPDNQLLDGRNRLDAMEMVGIEFKFAHGANGLFRIEVGTDGLYWPNIVKSDPYAYVISANIHRRHLTAEQKRELIAKLIKATPEKSDRQIAETVKASPTTVGTVRTKMEATGEVSKLDTRTDAKGVKQPARKGWSREQFQRHRAKKRGAEPEQANTSAAAKPRRANAEAERVLAEQMVDAGYRALAPKFHPDTGGSDDAFRQLNELREGFKRHLIPEYYRRVELLKTLNDLGPDP